MIGGHVTIINGPEYTLKQLLAGNQLGLEETAKYWWRYLMPKHFTVEGGRKYGYQKRRGDDEPPRIPRADGKPGTRANQAYSWRKRNRFRHNKPLVWSGQTERMVKQIPRVTVRQRRKDGLVVCRLAMNVPAYFYKYRKDLNQPDKYAELTRVSSDEQQELTGVHNAAVARHLQSMPRDVRRINV